ncbi:hypothetical protein QUB63_01415 [Microcoleus sp. ARI1-B5]
MQEPLALTLLKAECPFLPMPSENRFPRSHQILSAITLVARREPEP